MITSNEEVVTTSTGESTIHKNVRAILLDTRGPEIRMGKLANDHSGHETIHIESGAEVTLCTTDDVRDGGSTADKLYIDYSKLASCLSPGMKVLLDDGAIILTVTKIGIDGTSVICTADNSGELRSRAGVNLPGAETDLPAMSAKDRVDIKYGMTKDVDYVAASFIQNAEGVREIRAYMEECAKELVKEGQWEEGKPLPLIISKIESQSALSHFDDILEESDGIMVARGDLGVEVRAHNLSYHCIQTHDVFTFLHSSPQIPIQQVTNAQKEMVAACNAAGKPVSTEILSILIISPLFILTSTLNPTILNEPNKQNGNCNRSLLPLKCLNRWRRILAQQGQK
jgi:pyruvate kinase